MSDPKMTSPLAGVLKAIPYGSKDPMTDEEVRAAAWHVAYVLGGRDPELHFGTRYRMSHVATDEQRAWILRDALAVISNWGANPRLNDPTYPLD